MGNPVINLEFQASIIRLEPKQDSAFSPGGGLVLTLDFPKGETMTPILRSSEVIGCYPLFGSSTKCYAYVHRIPSILKQNYIRK